jgi:hypothetical protein
MAGTGVSTAEGPYSRQPARRVGRL